MEVPFSMVIGNVDLMHECPLSLAHGNSKNEIIQTDRRKR